RKFYWVSNKSRNESGSTDAEAISTQANQAELRGHDLYPILSSYLEQDLAIYAKRIDEKKSRNNRGLGGNRWLYPDIVGIENIAEAWDSEIVKAAEIFGAPRANIYSFEVKLQLTQSNVREAYFQAVSNSSWANFGYLVAAEVQGDDTATELRMLFGLHGIGVIQLNADEPNESQIIIPARQRSSVDWATCDRLFSENKDFNDFIIRARGYYQTSRFEPFKS
ncbi:MAG: HrgA protein, partial [Pseudomonadota bacterium]